MGYFQETDIEPWYKYNWICWPDDKYYDDKPPPPPPPAPPSDPSEKDKDNSPTWFEDQQGLPDALANDDEWLWSWTFFWSYFFSGLGWIAGFIIYIPIFKSNQWTWQNFVTYLTSGAGWIGGFAIFIPMSLIFQTLHGWILLYSTILLIFDSESVTLGQWFWVPLRKYMLQSFIMLLGYLNLLLPVVCTFSMPLLGALAVWDYLDYGSIGYVWKALLYPLLAEE